MSIAAPVLLAFARLFAAQDVVEVDPLKVFYMADFHDPSFMTMLPIPRGRLSARALSPPYDAVLTSEVSYVNGALALDPLRGVLYGNRCCAPGASIQAHDARTLELVASKTITLDNSGSLSIELDPLRRVLFVYDGKRVELTAVSIEAASYGQKLATLYPPLNADGGGSSSDCLAIDGEAGRLFLTGTDGGNVLSIDVSALYPGGGAFGEIEVTAQTARSQGDTGGSLAIDEVGRRVFVIPAHGFVRVFSADPPYSTIDEYVVERMAYSDCGLFYDGRNETLYVGRDVWQGRPSRPLAVDRAGVQREIGPTPFDGDDLTIYGISFAGATGPFAERLEAPIQNEPIAVREERAGCRCIAGGFRSGPILAPALVFLFLRIRLRSRHA
jgi:hypothetical protein